MHAKPSSPMRPSGEFCGLALPPHTTTSTTILNLVPVSACLLALRRTLCFVVQPLQDRPHAFMHYSPAVGSITVPRRTRVHTCHSPSCFLTISLSPSDARHPSSFLLIIFPGDVTTAAARRIATTIRKGARVRSSTARRQPLDAETPLTPSFVHLHLGIKADGLSLNELKSIHHINVPEWSKLTAPQARLVHAVTPRPRARRCHVIHAYLPATEPYEV